VAGAVLTGGNLRVPCLAWLGAVTLLLYPCVVPCPLNHLLIMVPTYPSRTRTPPT
jgi:hypothetical protein